MFIMALADVEISNPTANDWNFYFISWYLTAFLSLNFPKGFTKEFPSLRALITHHSVMPELLPVPLALPRPQNIAPQRRNVDDFDSYGSLTDFRKMMADLNV